MERENEESTDCYQKVVEISIRKNLTQILSEDNENKEENEGGSIDKEDGPLLSSRSSVRRMGNIAPHPSRTQFRLRPARVTEVPKVLKPKDGPILTTIEAPPLEERISRVREYRVAWFPRSRNVLNNGFVVDSKEGRTCIYLNGVCYLFGGYSPSMEQVYFEAYNVDMKKMYEVKPKNRDPLTRCFHSCSVYDDNLVVFGGEILSKFSENRLLTAEVLIFSTKTLEYQKVPSIQTVEPRKYHAACVVGSHLVVSGGVDEDGKVVSLIQTFNLSSITSNGRSSQLAKSTIRFPMERSGWTHDDSSIYYSSQNVDHSSTQA